MPWRSAHVDDPSCTLGDQEENPDSGNGNPWSDVVAGLWELGARGRWSGRSVLCSMPQNEDATTYPTALTVILLLLSAASSSRLCRVIPAGKVASLFVCFSLNS